MSIDVTTEILIRRPRDEVAEFMFDPTNESVWTTGVVESRPLETGRLRKGSRVDRVSKFMGRKLAYRYEVVDASEDGFVEMQVDEPFPMRIRYELTDAEGGTVARIRARGDATGFFKMAGPVMAPMVRRNITRDLEMLKAHLEKE